MTIAYSSISSSVQAGSTSVRYRAPAALSAGDLILWCVVNKYPTNGPNTPTGLSLLAQAIVGDGGAAGADVGDVYATVFSRESDGTEDGATESISIPGGNSATSRSVSYSRSAGSGWAIATASGSQGAAANSWSVTTGSLDLAAGDVVVAFIAKSADIDGTHSAHSFSASGVTFGSVKVAAPVAGTTQGDDCAMQIVDVPVTAGSGTGPVTFTMSLSGGAGVASGGVLLLRLREDAGASLPTLSAATYVPGSITSTGFVPRVTAS